MPYMTNCHCVYCPTIIHSLITLHQLGHHISLSPVNLGNRSLYGSIRDIIAFTHVTSSTRYQLNTPPSPTDLVLSLDGWDVYHMESDKGHPNSIYDIMILSPSYHSTCQSTSTHIHSRIGDAIRVLNICDLRPIDFITVCSRYALT